MDELTDWLCVERTYVLDAYHPTWFHTNDVACDWFVSTKAN